MHNNPFQDVAEFATAFEVDTEPVPKMPAAEALEHRWYMLDEEFSELTGAEVRADLVEYLDANLDIIYVAIGNILRCGVDPQPLWDRVHATNMAKLHDGKIVRNDKGKVVKPEGWQPPDIAAGLEEQGWVRDFAA